MEIKNIEELRNAFPEFVAQVETAARADGARAERERIQGIEGIQAAIGDAEMIRNAKFGDTPMTAEQLAFKAMQAQAAIGASVLNKLENDTANSGVSGVEGSPAPVDEPKAMTEDEQAAALLIGSIPANMKKEDK